MRLLGVVRLPILVRVRVRDGTGKVSNSPFTPVSEHSVGTGSWHEAILLPTLPVSLQTLVLAPWHPSGASLYCAWC